MVKIYFFTNNLNKEANRTEPSASVRVPCSFSVPKKFAARKMQGMTATTALIETTQSYLKIAQFFLIQLLTFSIASVNAPLVTVNDRTFPRLNVANGKIEVNSPVDKSFRIPQTTWTES